MTIERILNGYQTDIARILNGLHTDHSVPFYTRTYVHTVRTNANLPACVTDKYVLTNVQELKP